MDEEKKDKEELEKEPGEEDVDFTSEQDYVSEIIDIIRSGLSDEELKERLSDYHENDVAGAFEKLEPDERKHLYDALGAEVFSEIFAYVENVEQYIGEMGVKTAAKVQPGATWEFSAIPYLPTMDLVAQHAFNLAHEDVDGVMLSWSLGCCPSPNLTAYRDIGRATKSPDEFLDALAVRLYGTAAAPLARKEVETGRIVSGVTAVEDGKTRVRARDAHLDGVPL